MLNFQLWPYTHIFFGQNQLDIFLDRIQKQQYKNILLVYGKGSIKKSGLYDSVANGLHARSINTFDLADIDPNPRLSTVYKGIKLCNDNSIDFIVAIGGGSVIDCSKAIALGLKNQDQDIWDIIYNCTPKEDALPIGVVSTMAATGSETNPGFVISNEETKEKLGYRFCLKNRPTMALLDPTNTYTVSSYQTASGSADILSHILECYFSNTPPTDITDRILEGIAKAVIINTPKAINEPQNYDARANLMWSASMALNYIASAGRNFDWTAHQMEHALSAHFDIPHGHGLAILYPKFLTYIYSPKTQERFVSFFQNVFEIPTDEPDAIAEIGISKLSDFFTLIGCPARLRDFQIPIESLADIATECIEIRKEYRPDPNLLGEFSPLNAADIEKIYKECY